MKEELRKGAAHFFLLNSSFFLNEKIPWRVRRSFCAAGCCRRRRAAANSSSFWRCSLFRRLGTSTSSRAKRSPRSRPLTWTMPLPRSLKLCPPCVPAGTFKLAFPSSVGTGTSPPSAASAKEIGTSQNRLSSFALEDRVLLDVDDDVKVALLAAADARLAVARRAQPRAVRDPGRDFDFDPAGFFDPAFAVAGVARFLDHLAEAAAARAGLRDLEKSA